MEKNGQTVRVLDEQGTLIGYTYPKRAKGLVKKCRAEFVSDKEIRLNKQGPTYENMEDKEMDNLTNNTETNYNFITVNPREWQKNPSSGEKTVWDCFIISNPLAGAVDSEESMVEILSVGQWEWKGASRVTNGFQELVPETEYHLIFWLNGGENDRADETCQLQILFTDSNVTATNAEFSDGLCFRLNRSYIKPLKKYKGWEYYDIPFTTTKAKYTQWQFVADRAPMAVMPAKEPEVYKDLPDVPDIYEAERPQRHNIVFEDGWPVNQWYSTEKLAHPKKTDAWQDVIRKAIEGDLDVDELKEEILDALDVDELRAGIIESLKESMIHLQK
ncbi:MAG: hypothetical protein J1F22_00860 [Lachnospiraceae bacterium]|nr:hypothetical protein [Lachnospiraceae bacterium]